MDVAAGQRIELQERIGQVGAQAWPWGRTHLEVRVGNPYDYYSTYNPDLWIAPAHLWHATGRITDAYGHRCADVAITLQSETGPSRMTYSYADDTVNSDPYYGSIAHGICRR